MNISMIGGSEFIAAIRRVWVRYFDRVMGWGGADGIEAEPLSELTQTDKRMGTDCRTISQSVC